ncbi:hypothetical protein F5050DRAFT_1795281 [Lentinula boryana]|uniref:CCHC-type domain-containing protein n=1 Tax=Lentinula boryana TaxID=40481 RepID=A0ABQ8PX82_9AGAR|nr:hypothetical protein F5050DRAFT_1795281 [Lentinula boryana]
MSEVTLDQLQSVLTAEAFSVIAPIFTSIAQRLSTNEQQVANLQNTRVATQQLSESFREALSHITIPHAAPNPSVASARAPLRTELPLFKGRPEENVSAFISIAQDLLTATHISPNDWAVIVSGCFRDAALTWYLAKKQENGGNALTWESLEAELRKQFDHPARTDEIRTKLTKCSFKNNVTDFITQFQKLEMQLPPTEMTFGDRKFHFLRPLPSELAFHIANSGPKDMAAVYESARIWERHRRVTSRTTDNRRNPYTYSTPTSSSTSHFSSTAASSTNPVPMDLDVFTPHPNRSSRAPASKTNMSQVRCYNCQKNGHFAKDCPIPLSRCSISVILPPSNPVSLIIVPNLTILLLLS